MLPQRACERNDTDIESEPEQEVLSSTRFSLGRSLLSQSGAMRPSSTPLPKKLGQALRQAAMSDDKVMGEQAVAELQSTLGYNPIACVGHGESALH